MELFLQSISPSTKEPKLAFDRIEKEVSVFKRKKSEASVSTTIMVMEVEESLLLLVLLKK